MTRLRNTPGRTHARVRLWKTHGSYSNATLQRHGVEFYLYASHGRERADVPLSLDDLRALRTALDDLFTSPT